MRRAGRLPIDAASGQLRQLLVGGAFLVEVRLQQPAAWVCLIALAQATSVP